MPPPAGPQAGPGSYPAGRLSVRPGPHPTGRLLGRLGATSPSGAHWSGLGSYPPSDVSRAPRGRVPLRTLIGRLGVAPAAASSGWDGPVALRPGRPPSRSSPRRRHSARPGAADIGTPAQAGAPHVHQTPTQPTWRHERAGALAAARWRRTPTHPTSPMRRGEGGCGVSMVGVWSSPCGGAGLRRAPFRQSGAVRAGAMPWSGPRMMVLGLGAAAFRRPAAVAQPPSPVRRPPATSRCPPSAIRLPLSAARRQPSAAREPPSVSRQLRSAGRWRGFGVRGEG